MRKNNYPQSGLEDVEPEVVKEFVSSLMELHDRGKPETDDEVRQRIDDFFAFCQESCLRPGIESLSLALHVSRVTLFNWANGKGCSPRCQEYIQSAKAVIGAFIEQCMLGGKLNPVTSIFLCKNWLNYKDSISVEESAAATSNDERRLISREEMGLEVPAERPSLPGTGGEI